MARKARLSPIRFKYLLPHLGVSRPRILDVGCANHAPAVTKLWIPDCRYDGADIQEDVLDEGDRAALEEFFLVGVDGSGYEAMPEASYDIVILNHVVEHMSDPLPIVAKLCGKLKPGGLFWLAFPSLRSLALPHAEDTLHFCDDATHIRVPEVREICNVLLRNGVTIVHGGRSRDYFMRSLKNVTIMLPVRMLRWWFTKKLNPGNLWYVLGFEDHVLGRRKQA